MSKKVIWVFISALLLPVILITASALVRPGPSNESSVDTDSSDIEMSSSRSLTDEETAAGWYYDDSMDFGFKWLTAKEDRKHSCSGNCIVVKVVALTDCKYVHANGEVFNSGKDNARAVSKSSGWAGGRKSKSAMVTDQVRFITLKATKHISNRQHWYSVTEITCTPTN